MCFITNIIVISIMTLQISYAIQTPLISMKLPRSKSLVTLFLLNYF